MAVRSALTHPSFAIAVYKQVCGHGDGPICAQQTHNAQKVIRSAHSTKIQRPATKFHFAVRTQSLTEK